MKFLLCLILIIPAIAAAVPPGAVDPAITQDNIHETICKKGYTKKVRPPATYTTKLIIKQLRAQGLKGAAADYEEDHLIALELGGHPTDENNLWTEPWDDAHRKDKLENKLHRAVCKGTMSLKDAQQKMREWKQP